MNTQEQQTHNIQSQEQKNRNPKYSKICTQILPQKSIVHKHQPRSKWFFFFPFIFYVLIKSKSEFEANPMASFLGLEQIWVWVKKLPILFFTTSFISFEPKLKMVVVAASISSTSLFSPYTLVHPKTHNPQPHKPSNSKRKQLLRNPLAPPPRTNDKSKLLHPTLRRRSDVHPHSDATPPHNPMPLQCSSTPLSKAIPTSNIFDLSPVKPIYGFGF